MAEADNRGKRLPSAATIALAGAGLLAVASIGVAAYRSASPDAGTASHETAKPDQPVASVEEQIGKLRQKLQSDPDNPQGWRMLGWALFETGDLPGSADAYRRAAQIEPKNAENWSSLGEALQTARKELSPEAAEAFARAIKLDPTDPRARYFLAVQEDLNGNHTKAVDDWLALLKDTPPGAPWEGDLRRTILQVAEKEKIDVAGRMPPASAGTGATAGIPGPSPEQLAAASSLPPDQQDAMVKGMVEGLAARLAANPKDADGWIRLMRSRKVLGENDKAQAALTSGLQAFRGDHATQTRLRAAAGELGIASGG